MGATNEWSKLPLSNKSKRMSVFLIKILSLPRTAQFVELSRQNSLSLAKTGSMTNKQKVAGANVKMKAESVSRLLSDHEEPKNPVREIKSGELSLGLRHGKAEGPW